VDDLGELTLWRVGYHSDPLGFAPLEGYEYSHRFDDSLKRGRRSIYCAVGPETALREVMSDMRQHTAARARFIERYGHEAAEDLPPQSVPAAWRRSNVLVPVRIVRAGLSNVLDLTDFSERQRIEERHALLLDKHGMAHLDLNQITTDRRIVTQTIATVAYDTDDVGIIRYASSIDRSPCYALIEGRAYLRPAGKPVLLTDPPPLERQRVAAPWKLTLEPAQPRERVA
jgi:hypothetical protein